VNFFYLPLLFKKENPLGIRTAEIVKHDQTVILRLRRIGGERLIRLIIEGSLKK